MIELLKRVQKEAGVTALHVTHNRLEAERLADERLQIVDGKVIELRREAAQGNGKG
jgi:ABC-type Fe3+/spermidine/putrescine transport system ATPase subunit